MHVTLKLGSFSLQEAGNISISPTARQCDTLLSYLCAISWASSHSAPGQESKNQLKCLQQLFMLVPPLWKTWAAADSCALHFATLCSLNYLANPNGGHNHNVSKNNTHTYVKRIFRSPVLQVTFLQRYEWKCMCTSVLKSTDCISTCSFCMCKHMHACMWLYEYMGILNLQHMVHIIDSLKFKEINGNHYNVA